MTHRKSKDKSSRSAHSGSSSIIQIVADELRNEDPSFRVYVVDHLDTICKALGNKSKDDLIPLLLETANDDSDAVLESLSNNLSLVIPYIGGTSEAFRLAPIYLTLMNAALGSVRVISTQQFSIFIENLPPDHAALYIIPQLLKIQEEAFLSKVSIVEVFPALFRKLSCSEYPLFIDLLTKMSLDPSPLVRCALCRSLPVLTTEVSCHQSIEDLLGVFLRILKNLSEDECDSVRIESILPVCHVFRHLASFPTITITLSNSSTDDVIQMDPLHVLLSIIKSLSSDRFWKVRYYMAENFTRIIETLKDSMLDQSSSNLLVNDFARLLCDWDTEVRVLAVTNFSKIYDYFSVSNIESKILPKFENLSRDTEDSVKIALINVLSPIIDNFANSQVFQSFLITIFKTLSGDSSLEVKYSSISLLSPSFFAIFFNDLSPLLLSLLENCTSELIWKFRLIIAEKISFIGNLYNYSSKFSEFCDEIFPLFKPFFADPVYIIRETVVDQACVLFDKFDWSWFVENVVNELFSRCDTNYYVLKVSLLRGISKISRHVSIEFLVEIFIPKIISNQSHSSPNVRFNILKTIADLTEVHNVENFKNLVKPVVKFLYKDSDPDVISVADQLKPILKVYL
ncbi:hypothetical protein RCL1_008499 [Eukaryota sp. TZLM3-RCL]